MSQVEAGCPACGAPVTFKIGTSIVTVCEFCKSVVARGDRKFEDLGKVADLVDSGSPLDIGLKGIFRGVPFELTGRAQLGHSAGGMWDEWYAAFADGRWGWLAEAQGRFYLTFQFNLPQQALIPPFDSVEISEPVQAIQSTVPLMVAEKGEARMLGAKGEIPYLLIPGETYQYADLSGTGGVFGTIDYSETPPLVFIGREVTLKDLGLDTAIPPERMARRVAAHQLSCPKCAGPLELRAPDTTERVTCPNCGSLLDVTQGKLQFLSALKPGKVVPIIPIGSVGEFGGVKMTVIGFMQRSVEFSGVRYYWEEYLLYEPKIGFRWLVRSDDHWSFVQSVTPGEVVGDGRAVRAFGKRFKLYQDAMARVEYVIGEFYWKVTVGELVHTADFISPPQILSKELSMFIPIEAEAEAAREPKGKGKGRGRKTPAAKASGEVNWSLGTYVQRREVEKTFGIRGLPRPKTVAPNQPFPHKGVYKYWLLALAVTFVVGMIVLGTGSRQKVFEQGYQLQPMTKADTPHVIFTEPLDIKSRQNIRVAASGNVDNTWLYIDGDLIDETTGLVQQFSLPVEYYHGVDGGESWSEGDRSPDVYISALPSGRYTMRLEISWERWQQPIALSVRVEQGVPRFLYLFLTMVVISVIPVLVVIYHFSFEKRRWKDSDYSPYESSS